MSAFHFGLHDGKLTRRQLAEVRKIAGFWDCFYNEVEDPPGSGRHRGWFDGPNRGEPFNGALRTALLSHPVICAIFNIEND